MSKLTWWRRKVGYSAYLVTAVLSQGSARDVVPFVTCNELVDGGMSWQLFQRCCLEARDCFFNACWVHGLDQALSVSVFLVHCADLLVAYSDVWRNEVESKVYNLDNEVFYVSSTPNGYFLVTHGGPVGSGEIVGYFGPRFEGADVDLYGWATRSDGDAGDHNRVGALAWSRVSAPPTLEGQLEALCRNHLGQPVDYWVGQREGAIVNRQHANEEMTDFLNSLPEG